MQTRPLSFWLETARRNMSLALAVVDDRNAAKVLAGSIGSLLPSEVQRFARESLASSSKQGIDEGHPYKLIGRTVYGLVSPCYGPCPLYP